MKKQLAMLMLAIVAMACGNDSVDPVTNPETEAVRVGVDDQIGVLYNNLGFSLSISDINASREWSIDWDADGADDLIVNYSYDAQTERQLFTLTGAGIIDIPRTEETFDFLSPGLAGSRLVGQGDELDPDENWTNGEPLFLVSTQRNTAVGTISNSFNNDLFLPIRQAGVPGWLSFEIRTAPNGLQVQQIILKQTGLQEIN